MKELFNTILMIAIAMLLGGVINRVRSVLSGRRGPSIVQHLHNVALLARKGSVYSPTTSALFRVAPAVYMGSALLALLFCRFPHLQEQEEAPARWLPHEAAYRSYLKILFL